MKYLLSWVSRHILTLKVTRNECLNEEAHFLLVGVCPGAPSEPQQKVSREERVRQERRRLKEARHARRMLTPHGGQQRWGDAFRKSTGLPAVLRKVCG